MRHPAARELWSHPENDTRVRSAWERLLSGDEPTASLRALVDQSWHRCLADHVDPLRVQAAAPLTHEAVEALRRRHRRLLDASAPAMDQARDFLAQSATVMILTDADGIILKVGGDPHLRDPLDDVRLVPGASWLEGACGTNAIGTALALGQPVQIHGSEHFCSGIKRWTCSAAVIRDPADGTVLGVIDVSGLSRSYTRHSLALAITTAERVESRLAQIDMERRYRLLDHCMPRLALPGANGVLVFDGQGRLIKASESAADAMAEREIPFAPNAGTRIAALGGETPGEEAPPLPPWLPADWVEPVVVGHERLGTLVRIPSPRRTTAPPSGAGPATASGFARIVGHSPALLAALDKAQRLAQAKVPVLLLGETGVGKELFARGIHAAGPRADRPFVALNCGGLSRDLLASELFGYAEGAFTGARRGGMAGKIEAASGGTLFLDEIGELPLDLQPNFLRVLEDGEIYRLGETVPRNVDFRLVAATHRNLRDAVTAGHFRSDLYYRIAVTTVAIPPLRERRGDLRLLVAAMLAERCSGAPPVIDDAVFAALEAYDWPGNVRELRNVVEGLLLGGEGAVGIADLPAEIRPRHPTRPVTASLAGTLESAEVEQIRSAIRATGGNLTLAARQLGISKSTLYAKLGKYRLDEVEEARRARD